MRPIDAYKLKREMWDESHSIATLNECGTEEARIGLTISEIEQIIDNAPTVLHDNYSEGYQDGVRKVLSERPQGEWGKWIISVIKCPDCLECFHFPTEHYSMEMLKECPNCGADMREGRE